LDSGNYVLDYSGRNEYQTEKWLVFLVG